MLTGEVVSGLGEGALKAGRGAVGVGEDFGVGLVRDGELGWALRSLASSSAVRGMEKS